MRLSLLAAFALLVTGCAMPKSPTYEPDKGIGRKFCEDIANRAQLVSTQEMGVGVFLLTVGAASVTASGVLATVSANSTRHRELLGYLGAGLAVAPLIAVPFGMVLLSRSDEASALAATANTSLALSKTDEDAYRDCMLAKAAWVGSRADATPQAFHDLPQASSRDRVGIVLLRAPPVLARVEQLDHRRG